MKIFYIEDNKVFSVYFDYVLNLEALENELCELYEFWSYDKDEALDYLNGDSDA